ncbi:MAG TPA: hypothetical protein VIQ31_23545 [Phormidium sp.]
MAAQVLDKKVVDTPADSPEIFSIGQEDVNDITRAFYDFQYKQAARSAAVSGAAVGVGLGIVAAGSAQASPTGGGASNAAEAAAASIAAGVANAINMIKAIDGIGLAAFGVALAPMGFMVTLRVLNMVLSRV